MRLRRIRDGAPEWLTEHEMHVEQRVDVLREQREKLHKSFNRRRLSVRPTASRVQALEVRAKEMARLHAEATAYQARVLEEGRMVDSLPAEKRSQKGARQLAHGLDATLGFEAALDLFKARGRIDDLIRPENNMLGAIMPDHRELASLVLDEAEGLRVELLLRQHTSTPKTKLTVPRSPRLGSRPSSRHSPRALPHYRAAKTEFLALSPGWQTREDRASPA